jgi:hypothetical protein
MNWKALLGILLLVYATAVVLIAAKKPEKVWGMTKIKMFIKLMGEKGTVIFFYIFALVCATFGIFLLVS